MEYSNLEALKKDHRYLKDILAFSGWGIAEEAVQVSQRVAKGNAEKVLAFGAYLVRVGKQNPPDRDWETLKYLLGICDPS